MVGVLRGVASDITSAIANATYARLDGTNQPFTGALRTFSTTPNLTLENTASDASNAGTLIFKSDTETFTQTYDASANTFNMLYGANNVMKVFDTTALSLALGHGCSVSLTGTANGGIAVGRNCTTTLATGQNSAIAIGASCTATGSNSTSIGQSCAGLGTAIGNSATTVGGNFLSTAIGTTVNATFANATAIGGFCTATNDSALALGFLCDASGVGALAQGLFCGATQDASMAFGLGFESTAANAGVFGYKPSAVSDGIKFTNSTANSLMVAYEGTNFLLDVNKIVANKPVTVTGFNTAYSAKTGAYTTVIGDHTINCTSGTFTVTLLTAVGNTGKVYVIKNSGTGVITIDAAGAETIDGALTQTLNTQYQSYTLQSNGANWIIL